MSEEQGEGQEAHELPLRQRKKLRTRQHISDVASMLFIRHGFEQVTVAEVAKAAEVSTMTVFNHFPRKEDLFLDRIPEAIVLFTGAVRDRPAGETPLAALHRVVLELFDQGHPLVGVTDGFTHFWSVVRDSPALRARAREGLEELEFALARAITETTGADAQDPQPRLTAALAVAAYRAICTASIARILAGERAGQVSDDHRALVNRTFEGLRRALPEGS